MNTTAPRDYIKSILVALNRLDNGSTVEKGYLLEKLVKLNRWVERNFKEKLLREEWNLF